MDDRTERRIVEKATYVADAVEILAQKRDATTFEEYRRQRETRDVIEREFQTAIEACIDVGKMMLRDDGAQVPDTNAQVFRDLARRSILDQDVATRMAGAAGFRNVLAHNYGSEVDDRDVYNFLEHELPLFYTYLEQIRDGLE